MVSSSCSTSDTRRVIFSMKKMYASSAINQQCVRDGAQMLKNHTCIITNTGQHKPYMTRSLVLCEMLCRSSVVLLSFFCWSFRCLSIDLRILIFKLVFVFCFHFMLVLFRCRYVNTNTIALIKDCLFQATVFIN
jgi:hypothetical protein